MRKTLPKRRIYIVAKAPVPGAVKTRLTQTGIAPHDAAELAAMFLADTLTLAQNPAIQAEVILALDGNPDNLPNTVNRNTVRIVSQEGNHLGERLVNLFEQGFHEGCHSICLIGSDAPHLPPAFLIEAFGRLEGQKPHRAVFGPTDDGGYYLTGATQTLPLLFNDIPWSSPETLRVTLAKANDAGIDVAPLPPWYDIDTRDDLYRLSIDLGRGTVTAPQTQHLLRQKGIILQ